MRSNGDEGDLAFLRSVAPEKPVGGRGVLLNIGLEDFLSRIVGIFQRVEDVGLKGWVPGIGLQESEGFFDLLDQAGVSGGSLQALEFFVGALGKNQFKHQILRFTRRPCLASSSP